jgi:hypothetical protein
LVLFGESSGDVKEDSDMPNMRTEADFEQAAALLKCDVAAIKAVAEVESSSNGFLSDGRVKILFEGHQNFKSWDSTFPSSDLKTLKTFSARCKSVKESSSKHSVIM